LKCSISTANIHFEPKNGFNLQEHDSAFPPLFHSISQTDSVLSGLMLVSFPYRHTEYSVGTGIIYVSAGRVESFFSHLPIFGIIIQIGVGESDGKSKGMQSSPFRNPHV
jgi:hypothetical protein